jgi:hypothetical protein
MSRLGRSRAGTLQREHLHHRPEDSPLELHHRPHCRSDRWLEHRCRRRRRARSRAHGRSQGGNQIFHLDKADTDTRVQAYDKIWVKHIKSALMENRFAWCNSRWPSLQGEDPNMFDVLVRMLDHQGKEVLPAEFMAAPNATTCSKNIDRWVVGASLSFAAKGKPGCLFVASRATACSTLASPSWLKTQLATARTNRSASASRSPRASPSST